VGNLWDYTSRGKQSVVEAGNTVKENAAVNPTNAVTGSNWSAIIILAASFIVLIGGLNYTEDKSD